MAVSLRQYKYRAINKQGKLVKGMISAASEADLYNQLQDVGLELLKASPIQEGILDKIPFLKKKVQTRDLIQLFVHMRELQAAGVPVLESLADIRDTTDKGALRDIMSNVHRDVSDGASLSEAFEKHPRVFTSIFISFIKAGEESGKLAFTYEQLLKYLRWMDDMQVKIKKATRYPMILMAVILLTVSVMMGYVVPQIVEFIKGLDQELPVYTRALIVTSDFFKLYWWAVLTFPIVFVVAIRVLRSVSRDFSYFVDNVLLNMPVFGVINRKINIARYTQTFGALFSSGIDILKCLRSAQDTVTNIALNQALDGVYNRVQNGTPLSKALMESGEFPSLVVRMIRIGEDSGNLTTVMDQVSEFYTRDVDEAVSGLIAMIEPALTAILGGMLLWIAAGVFGPIYNSFESMQM
ncbi:MAG: type II secretion system F family protein [Alphaproteobacteria bacterium]|nr:type II secretion system F family protein [Alphaproteobacteria bacterium]